jgi:hypothetical protein
LHSIIPAPVRWRSSETSLAVKAAILIKSYRVVETPPVLPAALVL